MEPINPRYLKLGEPERIHELQALQRTLQAAPYDHIVPHFLQIIDSGDNELIRYLCQTDRYFLFTMGCGRTDAFHPWIYDRCREVEADTDGYLDLWARGHYKSSLITFAGAIQEILRNPDVTICIMAFVRNISKAFLAQIKREFEGNEKLLHLFPDILWDRPKAQAPSWSLDTGIIVRRNSNPKEATVEAYGLVDGQPTSRHYRLMIYDDTVSRESVTTAEQIEKTTTGWELSRNLKDSHGRIQMVGTRYSFSDTYGALLEREAVRSRIYPATAQGDFDSAPVFFTQDEWDERMRESSLETLACQMLQNPLAGSQRGFDPAWLTYYEVRAHTLNVAILGDPARKKTANTAMTAFAVIGIDMNRNKFFLDGMCHRMNLSERWKAFRNLRRKWLRQPGVQVVKMGYESFGAQADLDYFQEQMRLDKEFFTIHELMWAQVGSSSKEDRIQRLEPDFRNNKFLLPYNNDTGITRTQRDMAARGRKHLIAPKIMQIDENRKAYDVTQRFIKNEYLMYPASTHIDMLDAMSRFYDLELGTPQPVHTRQRTAPDPAAFVEY